MSRDSLLKKPKVPLPELVIIIFLSIVFIGVIAYIYYCTDVNVPNLVLGSVFIVFFISSLAILNELYKKLEKEYEKNLELERIFTAKLNRTYEGTLKALSSALDLRDHETWGHSARVIGYAVAIAKKMGLPPQEIRILAWGGFLHDIGKIGVKDSILLKEDKLTPEEWREIKRHPYIGYDMIRQVDFLEEAAEIVLFHHERYDGTGYPMGLCKDEIPLKARIFSVADTFDAMTSNRPYRRPRSVSEAIKVIRSQAGRQFCPECVKAFLQLSNTELMEIRRGMVGIDEMAFFHRVLTPDKSKLEKLNLA